MTVVTPTILSEGTAMDANFEVLSIDVSREVNRIPLARVTLIDGDSASRTFPVAASGFFDPAKEIEIKLRYEGGEDTTVFKGLVVRHRIEIDRSRSILTVDVKDAAVKLTHPRRTVVFRDRTDDAVIGEILEDAGLTKGDIPTTEPEHLELVQYQASDWDFIMARAEVQGLLVVVTDGEVSLAEIALGGSPAVRLEHGLSEIFEVEMELDTTKQPSAVESLAWDIASQALTSPSTAEASRPTPGDVDGGTVADTIGFAGLQLRHGAAIDPSELQAWADGRMARSRLGLIRGRVSVPGAADVSILDSAELVGMGSHFDGEALITGLRHRVDMSGWRTDLQFGLSADWFGRGEDAHEPPAAGMLPPVGGLQVGVVANFEEDPDGEGRLKVRVPVMDVDEEQSTLWARLATLDAGAGRGIVFRPEPDDEVVVGFLNQDPRAPIVLGSMFSSANAPPEPIPDPSEDNFEKAIVTKAGTKIVFMDEEKPKVFIETPGANKILLDDDGELIEISDQHGNTVTLNDGGIELKTDSDFKIEAGGAVEITGSEVNVK